MRESAQGHYGGAKIWKLNSVSLWNKSVTQPRENTPAYEEQLFYCRLFMSICYMKKNFLQIYQMASCDLVKVM